MSKYQDLSKEELLKLIEKQEAELKTKKYGLVWDSEKEPEQVVLDCENNIPILQRVKEKEIKTDESDDNILIEGDNYHALTCLNYTHKGKIDVIYIDPPYNRGGDFIYNDRRIEKDNGYKHSLWLNFMEKRLNLAKNILSEKGVMIISIDDFEYANLKLLCDKIFGENFVDTMIWRKSWDGRDGKMKNTTTFRKDHEYLIFCFNKLNKLNKLREKPSFQNQYPNPDNDPRGPYKAGSISRKESASNPNHTKYYTVISPSGKSFTRQFDISKEEFEILNNDILTNDQGINVSRIYWGKDGSAVPAIKIYTEEERTITPYSMLLTKGTTTEGTKEVSEILGKDCSQMRPKPTNLISTIIQLASDDNSIILDFFAGTGTTAHATKLTNLKYGGNRKYIVCTDNVESICSDYCYPRIYNYIKGYHETKGLNGNLQYFKTDLIPVERIDNISDHQRHELTEKAGQMIAIKENTFEEIEMNEWYQIFEKKDKSKKTAIYFRENMDEFENLVKKIGKTKTVLYVFSYSRIDKKIFNYLGKNIVLEDIPEPILEIYKEINLTLKDK